jgi:hypothetical protein
VRSPPQHAKATREAWQYHSPTGRAVGWCWASSIVSLNSAHESHRRKRPSRPKLGFGNFRCPLWVINGNGVTTASCPFFASKQTFFSTSCTSAMCICYAPGVEVAVGLDCAIRVRKRPSGGWAEVTTPTCFPPAHPKKRV